MSNLNFVDIIILIIFLSSFIIGLGRGFVSEVISLITIIAAIIIAIYFTNTLAAYFTSTPTVQGVVSSTTSSTGLNTATPVSYMALGISFMILFLGTMVAGMIAKSILNLVFATGFLGIFNSILGGVFGLIKGFFINLVLIFLMQMSPLSSQSWFQQSKLVGDFQPAISWLGGVVSPSLANLRAKFGQTVQSVGSTIQGATSRF